MEIKDWVTDMAEKCFLVRGIETSLKRIDAIIEHLNNYGKYDELSRETAKNWILFGDWTYRRNEQLTLNDFYPSSEQLSKGLNSKDLILLSRQEYQLRIKKPCHIIPHMKLQRMWNMSRCHYRKTKTDRRFLLLRCSTAIIRSNNKKPTYG
jgi:hypothetical protein